MDALGVNLTTINISAARVDRDHGLCGAGDARQPDRRHFAAGRQHLSHRRLDRDRWRDRGNRQRALALHGAGHGQQRDHRDSQRGPDEEPRDAARAARRSAHSVAAADRVCRRLRVDPGPGPGGRSTRRSSGWKFPYVATDPRAALPLRRLRRQRDQVRRLLLADRHQVLPGDRLAHARAYLRRARPGGDGDSDLALGAVPAFGAQRARAKRSEHERRVARRRCCIHWNCLPRSPTTRRRRSPRN